MREPQLLHPAGLCRQTRRLAEQHVTILARLRQHLILAIHPLADKQIRIRRRRRNRRHRARIRAIGQLQPLARRPQHHIRRKDASLVLNRLALLLQAAPELHRNPLFAGALRIELARARQRKTVAIARHPVLHLERVNIAIAEKHRLLRRLQLAHPDIERQVRRNRPQRMHHTLRPHRPDDGKILLAAHVAHRQQQPRQPRNVVCVQMRQQNLIHRLQTHPHALRRNLRPLAAINQHAMPLVAHHQRGEPSIHQRQRPAGPQKTNINHTRSFSYPPPHCQE